MNTVTYRAGIRLQRTLVYVGRIAPTRCRAGSHVGTPMDRARFENAGGIWNNLATCSACSSTVNLNQFRRAG